MVHDDRHVHCTQYWNLLLALGVPWRLAVLIPLFLPLISDLAALLVLSRVAQVLQELRHALRLVLFSCVSL